MSFDLDDAPRRLLDRGWIEPADVIGGGLEITVVSRRNQSLRVRRGSGASLFVKRADPAVFSSRRTLAREVSFYDLCRAAPLAREVGAYLAPVVGGDESEGLLVLEWLDGFDSLWTAYRRHRRLAVPRAPLRALGKGLGAFHRALALAELADRARLAIFPEILPRAFAFHRPKPGDLRGASAAQVELLRILQEHRATGSGLEAAAALWRKETLLHGDLRGANVLVARDRSRRPRLVLIDWELARRGDPAWDLGGVLADTLAFWVDGMSHQPDRTPEQRARSALYPLDSVRRALAGFWRSYLGAARVESIASASLERRAVPFAAVRLIQFAWEYASRRAELPPRALLLAQLATNILARPGRSARTLFGLGDRDPATGRPD